MSYVLLLVLLWVFYYCHLVESTVRRSRYFSWTRKRPDVRASRKPDWVRKELIRLKAHLPNYGCRKLADLFNSLHSARGMTVSKSFVYELLKQHRYEVLQLRRLLKNRIPSALPCNHTWGLDMTGKMDDQRNIHSILGIVDHGSRKALCLLPLRDQSTIAILRALLDVIERCGKPRRLRTDNGPQFRSYLFRFCLTILRIKQQFSKPGMPLFYEFGAKFHDLVCENSGVFKKIAASPYAILVKRTWTVHRPALPKNRCGEGSTCCSEH